MSLGVETFVNGRWRQNCYIVFDADSNAVIIDPGSQANDLIALIEQRGWRPRAIVNTHGHFDHIGAVADLQDRFAVPFYLHCSDARLLERANLFRMVFESRDPISIPKIDKDISKLPESFEVESFRFSWIPTPGHTDGSVCLRLDNLLFSGDTLMREKIGRTDLPGGNRDSLLSSLRKLMSLPGETVVYGGHGPQTTIAAEFSPGSRVLELLS